MKLWHIRRGLYRDARLLGHVRAVERGPAAIVKRAERKWLGH
jgi:hypothetical protein